jgi:hypothetical protein
VGYQSTVAFISLCSQHLRIKPFPYQQKFHNGSMAGAEPFTGRPKKVWMSTSYRFELGLSELQTREQLIDGSPSQVDDAAVVNVVAL